METAWSTPACLANHHGIRGAGCGPKPSRRKKPPAAGLFDGSLVAPFGYKLLGNLAKNLVRAKQPQKDTANTALLALKRGRVLGLMEQCRPCEFKIYQDATIETVKPGSN